MLRAALFDLDGLLIDSEPFWGEEELAVFLGLGVPMTLELCRRTRGLRIDEVVRHWHRQFPWDGPSIDEVVHRILDRVAARIRREAHPKAGALHALELARNAGLALAIATSSPMKIVDAALERLAVAERFRAIVSAEYLAFGKPHPEIFLRAAEEVSADACDCIVLEDSLNGVIAAKAARMRCVAVPGPDDRSDPRFCLADVVLDSLDDLDARVFIGDASSGAPVST